MLSLNNSETLATIVFLVSLFSHCSFFSTTGAFRQNKRQRPRHKSACRPVRKKRRRDRRGIVVPCPAQNFTVLYINRRNPGIDCCWDGGGIPNIVTTNMSPQQLGRSAFCSTRRIFGQEESTNQQAFRNLTYFHDLTHSELHVFVSHCKVEYPYIGKGLVCIIYICSPQDPCMVYIWLHVP